jgi:hypothetical protein
VDAAPHQQVEMVAAAAPARSGEQPGARSSISKSTSKWKTIPDDTGAKHADDDRDDLECRNQSCRKKTISDKEDKDKNKGRLETKD